MPRKTLQEHLQNKFGEDRYTRFLTLVQDPSSKDATIGREFDLTSARIGQIRAVLGNPNPVPPDIETIQDIPPKLQFVLERSRELGLKATAILDGNGKINKTRCMINDRIISIHFIHVADFTSQGARTKWSYIKVPRKMADILIVCIDLPGSEMRTFVIPWQHVQGKKFICFPESSSVYPQSFQIAAKQGIPPRRMSGLGLRAESRSEQSQSFYLQFLEAWHLLKEPKPAPE